MSLDLGRESEGSALGVRRGKSLSDSGRSGGGRSRGGAGLSLETLEPRKLLSGAGAAVDWYDGITTTGSDAPAVVSPIEGWGSGWGGSGVVSPDPSGEPTLASGAVQGDDLIGLTTFRNDSRFAGIDGSGMTAVVLDTGADLDHSWFGPDSDNDGVADSIVYHYDFAMNDDNASDPNGHGSNVASIIGSRNTSFPGVAPGVNLIILKVFRDNLGGSFSYIEEALQWVVANVDTYNIVSVNMSLSDQVNHTQSRALYGVGDELLALANMGVINVSAAGNQFYAYGGMQGVGYPAVDPNVLAVGASYARNEGGPINYQGGSVANSTDADRLLPFSQRHTELVDIFAPGGITTGANRVGGTNAISGTSQASPHIAGVAVLMQQLAEQVLGRRLTVAEFADLIRDTAVSIFDGDDEDDNVVNTNATYRRIDVAAAAEALVGMAQVNSAPTLTTIASFAGGQEGQAFTITYDALLAASDASDTDGDAIVFSFAAPLAGTLTKGGVDLTLAGGTLAAGESIVWTPGEGVYGMTTALRVLASDGVDSSKAAVDVVIDVNARPVLDAALPTIDAVAGQPVEIDFDSLAALASDAYGGRAVSFLLLSVPSGSVTLNGAQVSGGEFTSGDTLVWTPGANTSGAVEALRFAAFDGEAVSAAAVLGAEVNGRPTFAALPTFSGATAGAVWSLEYDGLLAAATASDPEGDGLLFEVVEVLAPGVAFSGGSAVVVGSKIGVGASLLWTAAGLGVVDLLRVRVWDGASSSADVRTLAVEVAAATNGSGNGEPGEPGGDGGDGGLGGSGDAGVPEASVVEDAVVGTGDGAGGTWFVRRDAEGVVTLFEAGEGGEWSRVDLSGAALGELGDGAAVWVDSFTGLLTVALVTQRDGLVVLERDALGAWSSSVMADAVAGGETIVSSLVRLSAVDGRVTLAGLTESGDLVAFQQGAIDAVSGRAAWTFASVADDLSAAGVAMPELEGGLIGFVTSWNAHNVAALNASGEILAFWWSPGREAWALTNLSANTGAPAIEGGLTAYLTPWGGINVGGVNADGQLVMTWWVPAFGAQWRTTDLTTAVGGPRLSDAGVSAFVTPWGALNIAGFREDGAMVVYWWAPGQASWSVAAIGEQMGDVPSISRAVTGLATAAGQISVAGLNDDGELVRYWWQPGSAWTHEVLDFAAVDVARVDLAA